MLAEFLDGKVVVTVGDITKQTVDAIVNAANSSLLGGGGVDGAIHRAGGETIYQECYKIRQTEYPKGLPTGQAILTAGGNLPARFVIHTVGPVYGKHNGQEAKLLADCYKNSLALAAAENILTIAFPAISTGVYGYPPGEAAKVVSQALKEFLSTDNRIKEVRLVFFQDDDAEEFLNNHAF
jgi:O-acetyl-ADP-ribose deacetylase